MKEKLHESKRDAGKEERNIKKTENKERRDKKKDLKGRDLQTEGKCPFRVE